MNELRCSILVSKYFEKIRGENLISSFLKQRYLHQYNNILGGVTINIRPKFSIVTLVISVLLLILVLTLKKYGIYLQLGIKPLGFTHFELTLILIITILVSTLSFLNNKVKDKGTIVYLAILGSLILMLYLYFYIIIYHGVKYTRFTSPIGKEEFLVIESASSELYQVTGKPFYMEKIADLQVYRRFQPFHTNNYKLQWREPGILKITYNKKGTGTSYTEVLIEYKTDVLIE